MRQRAPYTVHESAYVDDNVVIGRDTCIWHFCHLMTGSQIGERCRIGQNVVIGPRSRIGDNVKIQNNVSIYEGVTLEDSVFCGPSAVFTNVLTPRCEYPRNSHEDFSPTLVRHGASIGANATIVCGVTIGRYALVGAGAVVTKDVPDYAIVYGNPARRQGWACECGRALDACSPAPTCTACRRKYEFTDSGAIIPFSDNESRVTTSSRT